MRTYQRNEVIFTMAIKVIHLRQYTQAVKESHLDGSHFNSALKAELHNIEGDLVYFRNYEDVVDTDFMEFCFTRNNQSIKFNYMSYRFEDEECSI